MPRKTERSHFAVFVERAEALHSNQVRCRTARIGHWVFCSFSYPVVRTNFPAFCHNFPLSAICTFVTTRGADKALIYVATEVFDLYLQAVPKVLER